MIHAERPRHRAAMADVGRPRVLQIGKFYPPHMGGIETHLQTLCQELRADVDVQVLVANATSELREERVDGIDVTRLGTAFSLSTAPVCPALVNRFRSTPADIVHIHLPNPGAVLAYLVSGHSGRLVISYHSDIVRQQVLERLFRPFLDRFLRRAEAIIVATPNHIDSSPLLPAFRDRCRVVPYGIPLPDGRERDAAAVMRIRERFGPRIVLGVGRLVYYKGFEYLIRAMREVDAQLVLIGDGPLRSALEREARAHGVADRVAFLGKVDDLTPYYRAADLFVLPSVARSEAFGIVQLEAMACGTPVVNTRLDSGVPYVSLDGVSGLTVPPADVGSLAAAIGQLLDDDALRAELGAEGRRRVEQEFTKEVMARRTLEVYADVLAAAGVPTRPASPLRRKGGARPMVRPAISLTDSAT